ncbi:hypothetical protein K501DRAFT_245533, partial [Backusella circina FSU 941]
MDKELCQPILKALGTFDYVAATKLIAKLTKLYQPMGTIFSKLNTCESSFTQLLFLRSRWFVMRKDTSVELVYGNLVADLRREVAYIEQSALDDSDKYQLSAIMIALEKLCQVRKEMINIYQAILAQSIKGEFNDILSKIVELQKTAKGLGNHLDILGIGVEKEINILTSFLRARKAIVDYAFQDACIALYTSKQDLMEWKKLCQEQDYPEKSSKSEDAKETSSWRFTLFGAQDNKVHKYGDTWPNTMRWYSKVLGNITAKMTLYFNSILLEKESIVTDDDPEKALWKGLPIDYNEHISTFKKRFGPHSIGLVYEVTNGIPFHPHGYVCPDSTYEAPQGIHSFPFIYCYPKEAPNKHLPSIISIIQGSKHKLNDPKAGPVYFFDNTVGSTYYLMRVDEHVVLVIIYLDRHVHREITTIEFMNQMVTLLRGSTVIEELITLD